MLQGTSVLQNQVLGQCREQHQPSEATADAAEVILAQAKFGQQPGRAGGGRGERDDVEEGGPMGGTVQRGG